MSKHHHHVGWFKRRHEVKPDDLTIVDNSLVKRAVGAAALGNAMSTATWP